MLSVSVKHLSVASSDFVPFTVTLFSVTNQAAARIKILHVRAVSLLYEADRLTSQNHIPLFGHMVSVLSKRISLIGRFHSRLHRSQNTSRPMWTPTAQLIAIHSYSAKANWRKFWVMWNFGHVKWTWPGNSKYFMTWQSLGIAAAPTRRTAVRVR